MPSVALDLKCLCENPDLAAQISRQVDKHMIRTDQGSVPHTQTSAWKSVAVMPCNLSIDPSNRPGRKRSLRFGAHLYAASFVAAKSISVRHHRGAYRDVRSGGCESLHLGGTREHGIVFIQIQEMHPKQYWNLTVQPTGGDTRLNGCPEGLRGPGALSED